MEPQLRHFDPSVEFRRVEFMLDRGADKCPQLRGGFSVGVLNPTPGGTFFLIRSCAASSNSVLRTNRDLRAAILNIDAARAITGCRAPLCCRISTPRRGLSTFANLQLNWG